MYYHNTLLALSSATLEQIKTEHPFMFLLIVTFAIIAIATPGYIIFAIYKAIKKRK